MGFKALGADRLNIMIIKVLCRADDFSGSHMEVSHGK